MTAETEAPAELAAGEAGRSTLLAEMANLSDAPADDSEGTVDLTQDSAPDEAAQEEAAAQEEVTEEEVSTEEVEAAPVDETPDADAALEMEQQREKRFREKMAADKADFAKEQESHAEKLAEADRIIAAQATREQRASFDPVGALKLQTPEQMMAAAKQLYQAAKAAGPDATPEQREAANRALATNQQASELEQLKAEVAAMKTAATDKESAAAHKQEMDSYIDGVATTAGDETPLVRNLLAGKGAKMARERILNIASYLAQSTGEPPEAVDVLRIYEDSEREALIERGIDPDSVAKATTPKTNTPAAVKAKSATLGNDLGTSTTMPRSEPLSDAEEKDDILKGMAGL